MFERIKEPRAVIYCRVSTEEQAREGESLESQRRRCLDFAMRHEYKVAEEFIERGESGRSSKRTQFQKMYQYVIKNSISAIICLKIDRFMRNAGEYAYVTKKLKDNNIRVLFVEGTNQDDAQGRLLQGIAANFAEFESNVNSERTKDGLAQAVLGGRWVWPLRGYCFKMIAGKRTLTPNEDAVSVRKMFEMAHKGIYTQQEIVNALKRLGHSVSKQNLSRLLRNPVYCGLLPDKYKQNGGKFIRGIHEPLVSEKVFFEVQDILNGRRRALVPRLRNNPEFPLRRFVICPKCGRIMTACFAQGKKIKVGYYQCLTKGCPRVQKKVLEAKYLEFLKEQKPSPNILKAFEEEVLSVYKEQTKSLRKEKIHIENEIKNLELKKSRVIDLLARGIIPEEDGQKEIERINKNIAEQKSYLGNPEGYPSLEECWTFAKYFINNMDTIWEKGDLNLRQRVQGLITPSGFKFEDNLIKPIKNPEILSIFQQKSGVWNSKGG